MRRKILSLGLLAAWAALAQPEAARLEAAYRRLDEFIERQMRESGTPGMAVGLTNRAGLLRVSTHGFANLESRAPVRPETLFEIGSISKSFTAIAVLLMREARGLDLDAPPSKYLPWFKVRSSHPPLAIRHLLSHTAGLPRDRDDLGSTPYTTVALAERATGFAPGTRFAYSNVGYQVLGYVLEAVSRETYAQTIRGRILDPLGMQATEPVITHETRRRLATGYSAYYDDRPAHRSHGLAPAPWLEYGQADGSIASTAGDMAAYLRMLLHRGAGPAGRVLSLEAFQLLTQRAITTGGGGFYGFGMGVRQTDGHTVLSHSGGMIGYAADLAGDLDAGVGVVALTNGPGSPSAVTRFALRVLRAAVQGKDPPPLPASDPPERVVNAADYAASYAAPGGKKLVLAAAGDRLVLEHRGQQIVLERHGSDAFYANHADFALYLLRFARQKGAVVEASHGPDWYAKDSYAGPREFHPPAAWKAYPGHYRTQNPWFSNFRVVLRKGQLWMVRSGGGEGALTEIEPGVLEAEGRPGEQLRLDTVINGQALRANFSGVDFYRTFTP